MPRGTVHDETGWINWEANQLVLLRDDGGRWRLDAPSRTDQLVGKRVRIIGTRSGFDLLDVTSITPIR